MTTNVLRVTRSYVYQHGTLKTQYFPGSINYPQTTKGVMWQTITATTAQADIAHAQLSTPAKVIMHNLESTTTGKIFNWGLKSSTGGIPQYFQLKPKDIAEVCLGTSAMEIRGKAASGSLQVLVISLET